MIHQLLAGNKKKKKRKEINLLLNTAAIHGEKSLQRPRHLEITVGFVLFQPAWYLPHVFCQFKHLEVIFTPSASGKKFKQMRLR